MQANPPSAPDWAPVADWRALEVGALEVGAPEVGVLEVGRPLGGQWAEQAGGQPCYAWRP